MSSDTSDFSSYFDGREPDELIKAIVEKRPGTDGKTTLSLQFIDLESNKVFIKAMPPDTPSCPTAVSCGNHVYILRGIRENDANFGGYEEVNDVFQLDLKDLERGWRKTTSMLFPRAFPHVLAAEGKIYVFECMGSESFGEVYDISGDIWEPLSPPLEDIDIHVSCVPVLDSSRSQILVHCRASDTLYAYYYDRKSWVCLEQKICYWSDSAAIVWTMCCILLFINVLWRRIICLIRNICPSNGHQNFQCLHHRKALCIVWAMASIFWVGSTISIFLST
ncbi:hypothetical protein ES332_D06G047400v1 [Gossypium tomentosum]|uniref:Uncharacterized protein n=1 Tax=Gossypium tomentosum TaxID=34277 RepID=A0A5D2KGP1_GOSTO|nr:hypothetical protein ES332_D06G047400v1 [Gossypium tomentosum]TYH65313.1 hypothetical protein ES332_D06G047400v1 [Gossypium tomentosum]TYH65314.1 hypothetical protein ES332_D06G047400v1 [Gossypium tomentosum]